MDEDTSARLTGLFEGHYDEVLAYCARRIGRTDAEDAVAEVFAIASRRATEIRWSTARPWLYGIARGVVANRVRSDHRGRHLLRRLSGVVSLPQTPPDEVVVRTAEAEEALRSLRLLSPNDREVLMLAAWEELTAPQIAGALGISVEAAEKRLQRAKARFARTVRPVRTAANAATSAAEEGGKR